MVRSKPTSMLDNYIIGVYYKLNLWILVWKKVILGGSFWDN